jgi:hypothetical protein
MTAAIEAQVVDIANDRVHKGSIRIILHVPVEKGGLLTACLGWPSYTNPVPVALARLNTAKQIEAAKTNVAPEKRLVQRAGIMCNDPLFFQYLNTAYKADEPFDLVKDSEMAAIIVRKFCRVQSRSEILVGTEAATRFDLLESAFIAWRDKDKFIEL